MRRERMLVAFLMAVVGVVLFGLLRPSSPDPRDDDTADQNWFYINKVHRHTRHDVILLGDSRVLHDISPAALTEEIPGASFFNFAFEAGSLNPEIFAEAEARLDTTRAPAVLMGITALMFQPWKADNKQFHQYKNMARDVVFLYLHAPDLARFFRPLPPSALPRRWLGMRPSIRFLDTYHGDGWLESTCQPLPAPFGLEDLREKLSRQHIDTGLVDALMAQVRTWRNRGVAVFGVYPPADPQRLAIELETLRFDTDRFRKRFEAAGGIWLDVPGRYVTYDGSHLERESAVAYSHALGRALRPYYHPEITAAGR